MNLANQTAQKKRCKVVNMLILFLNKKGFT